MRKLNNFCKVKLMLNIKNIEKAIDITYNLTVKANNNYYKQTKLVDGKFCKELFYVLIYLHINKVLYNQIQTHYEISI